MIARFFDTTTRTWRYILLFVIAGLLATTLRAVYFDDSTLLPENTIWKLSMQVRFTAEKQATTLQSVKPKSNRHYRLISQRFYHPDFKVALAPQNKKSAIRITAIRSGVKEFIAEYHLQRRSSSILPPATISISAEEREKFLSLDEAAQTALKSLQLLNERILKSSHNKPELIHHIFLYCQNLIKSTHQRHNDIRQAIRDNKATTYQRAALMVALSRLNQIPARVVTGFELKEQTSTRPYYWVEVYDEEQGWQAYDPEKGHDMSVPDSYLQIAYDRARLFQLEQGELKKIKYTISEDIVAFNILQLQTQDNVIDMFDLRRLDADAKQTITLILLLPICVLLTAILRYILGLYPYGTFTAPLLALAMIYAEMVPTLVIMAIIVTLALAGRAILPKSLSRVPRLSLLFTFVSLGMVFSISIMDYFELNHGGNIIMLPIIILVAIVDRIYSYMDDAGTHAALLRLSVTLLIAVLCIPIMKIDSIGRLVLAYPELHFITAALVLMVSLYKGKKPTDHRYLKLLGENKKEKKSKKKTADKPSEESEVA